MRLPPLPLLLLAGAALAGCSGDGGSGEADGTDAPPSGPPALSGWVFDPAIHPVAGANLTIASANATAVSDAGGRYAFATDLPLDELLVVVTQAPGYTTLSKSVTLSARGPTLLNFTLERVPVLLPTNETQDFNGFISCKAVVTSGENTVVDCGAVAGQTENVWDFNVGPNLAGVVLEVEWAEGTPLAEALNLTVETVGFGDSDATLAWAEGPSILRAQVNQAQGRAFYGDGGTVRAIVTPASNADQEETAIGAGATVQQDFHVIASIFYVEPPPPTFSAGNG
ncbi:MAG TPA: carboxypeptidase-like regulatory domain-containing protein [Candidatus Thermoplasmatota archaeon]|nr:carboxypeptidase-like regulatory domain-containing protein [Candidatus Thermoplasmatota archaeon]